MRKKQLLFVTYHDENFGEGLSYAVDLAKTMSNGIAVLMVYKRKVMEKFEDMMTVITFAEAGEHKTAREMIIDDLKKNNMDYEERTAFLKDACSKAGVAVDINFAAADVVSAVRNFLKQNSSIDMVLLSPNVTVDGKVNSKDLNRLVRTASRPIVTMARNAHVA